MIDGESGLASLDTAQPHIARVYDYLLGGKDNYGADRAVGDQIIATAPTVQVGVRAQREVLGRVVRFLVAEAGVRQLIDIGSGLPTADNVHQIARRIDSGCRVVYVDNDPVVLAHARALLADENATIVVDGDLRDPDGIVGDPAIRAHLDWEQPIGLLLCGILHHILDSERPEELTRALGEALPPGSYVFIHHLLDSDDPAVRKVQAVLRAGMSRGQFRTLPEVRGFFGGLELVEPGLVLVPEWRPDPNTLGVRDDPVLAMACAGVARKSA
ncbi:MAG TPA: SAM-dependent methyltransferase [Streptosporangiaceae bacterium]|nr:SAM-dependent methyltransferase [Streptosporangiaceae bacterium]